MPGVKIHCAISEKRTGFAFAELHKWIDEDTRAHGVNHRNKRHYLNDIDKDKIKKHWDNVMGEGWGEKAIVEWLFHIALDNLYTAYKFSLRKDSYGANTYNRIEFAFNRNGYIDCEFKRIPGTPSFTR